MENKVQFSGVFQINSESGVTNDANDAYSVEKGIKRKVFFFIIKFLSVGIIIAYTMALFHFRKTNWFHCYYLHPVTKLFKMFFCVWLEIFFSLIIGV